MQAESSLPFDAKKGVVPNEGGRVEPGEVLLLFLLFISFICQYCQYERKRKVRRESLKGRGLKNWEKFASKEEIKRGKDENKEKKRGK